MRKEFHQHKYALPPNCIFHFLSREDWFIRKDIVFGDYLNDGVVKIMAHNPKIEEFPDISNKLQAPTKKSVFERQKAEAEAKRQRDQEETAAAYEDFVKSFDDEGTSTNDPQDDPTPRGGGGFGAAPSGGGFSRRHFSGLSSGPLGRGGRGSGPGSLGPPPPSVSRKRTHEESQTSQRGGLFAFDDAPSGPADPKTALQHSDDEETGNRNSSQDRVIPKPTLRLSSLPPGTSPAAIKAIMPSTLTIEGVKIMPPRGPGTTERRSLSAILTLVKDTPAVDIDTAVSALQNKYMGRGFNLSISRHLSSATATIDAPIGGLISMSSSLPFNAKPVPEFNTPRGGFGGPHRGGYAPPSTYTASIGRNASQVQVNINPPGDLKELKLIHKTLEALLTHGPEFEALLMSRREVQMDEKWSWMWNARSPGGVYYRWRLWDTLTGFSRRARRGRNLGIQPQQIFENGASWVIPQQNLPYEYTTRMDEFVSDTEYDSSEDEDSGDEGRRRYAQHHGGAPPPDGSNLENDHQSYLNPLQKAKLTHLLARLPNSNAKLRRGDVARVTAFAIQHAGEGADEVVQMIVGNVHQPYSFTSANPDRPKTENETAIRDTGDATNAEAKKLASEDDDTTPSKLIALYLISDILSTSSTSGVRHAWRYRSLFESVLKTRETFEHLGRLEKTLNWGRLRAEKWKRSVGSVLSLWEGWCVFPQTSQEHFANVFNDPPLTPEEEAAKVKEVENEREKEKKSKWKSVEDRKVESAKEDGGAGGIAASDTMDVDDVDGEPMAEEAEEEDLDGEPMVEDDDDVDGEPMPADDAEEEEERPSFSTAKDPVATPAEPSRREALAASIAAKLNKAKNVNPTAQYQESNTDTGGLMRKRQRPKAEDMFADSEGE